MRYHVNHYKKKQPKDEQARPKEDYEDTDLGTETENDRFDDEYLPSKAKPGLRPLLDATSKVRKHVPTKSVTHRAGVSSGEQQERRMGETQSKLATPDTNNQDASNATSSHPSLIAILKTGRKASELDEGAKATSPVTMSDTREGLVPKRKPVEARRLRKLAQRGNGKRKAASTRPEASVKKNKPTRKVESADVHISKTHADLCKAAWRK